MNDWSYACIAKLLGIAIAEAATRSIAAVAVHPAAISAEPDVYLAELGRSHSASFDHRRRPETLRTAMATAFFCPTSTTSRFPLVTPV